MAGSREKLLTASDLAALCEVDLKTIHNWVDRGRIAHFRTPGRHLRFRAPDVAEFLKTWGYSVPRELSKTLVRTALVLSTAETFARLSKEIGEHTAVRHVADPYDALIYAGAEPADVYVVASQDVSTADATGFLDAVQRAAPNAKFIALVDDPNQPSSIPPFVERVRTSDMRLLQTMLRPEEAEAPASATGTQGPESELVEVVPRRAAAGS